MSARAGYHFGNVLTMEDALGKTENYTYSALGRLQSKTDRNGVTTTYGYDALGRVIETVTSLGDVLSYTYAMTGQVLTEQDNNQLTEYTYDELGRVVSVTETELSQVELPILLTITLDPNGGTLVDGNTYTVWSDDTVTLPIPSRAGYGFEGWCTTPSGIPNDTVSEILADLVAAGGTEITLYAIWDKTPDATVPTVPTFPTTPPAVEVLSLRGTGNSYTKTYTYDLAGNRTSFQLTKDGETVHNVVYQYDALNRLTSVAQSGLTFARYEYDANGNRTRLTYPTTGTVTYYAYNLANWVTDLFSEDDRGITLADCSYTYYASGNRRGETDGVNSTNTTYIYDDLGRLVQESETAGLTVQYAYDSAGNRTRMAVSGTEKYTVSYTYDKNNLLSEEHMTVGGITTTTDYAYDANGNLIRKSTPNGAELYDYNGFDQLTVLKQGGTATTYAYNASGIRTAKRTADTSTYFLLDGGNVVAEYTDGVQTAFSVWGINLISRKSGGTTKFYVQDAHGDVVCVTENTGVPIRYYAYDAFGNEKNPDSTDSNPFRYCGEYFDKETGTYYLRARYYDPAIGRFTQQDSVLFTTRKLVNDYEYVDPLSLNLYTYCYNNPAMYMDRSGHVPYSSLNALSYSYDNNMVSADFVSLYVLTHTGKNLHLAFHQIAQLNLAKMLHGLGYSPVLEYRIPKVGRVDVVAGGMAWEVKVMPLSGAKQMEKYMNEGGLLAGHEFIPILDIPIFDEFKMGIVPSLAEPGVAHYFFYRQNKQKEYEIVTNIALISAYRKRNAQPAVLTTGQGDLGYAILMLIGLSFMGGVMGELEPSMVYAEP